MQNVKRKVQNQSFSVKTGSRLELCEWRGKFKTFLILSFSFTFFVFRFTLNCAAEEITIFYTAETHGMIYHCNCPVEPDGGVSRRATLLNQLRKIHPNSLTVEGGSFFAGGLQDIYTQNTKLDMLRSQINLKAMEIMGYDAVAIGPDEFNFGQDFLLEQINSSKLNFLTSNIILGEPQKTVVPFIIKEVANVKCGIIGVSSSSVRQKESAVTVADPAMAVKEFIQKLKSQQVGLIIVLSNLKPAEEKELLSKVSGIDVVIGLSRSQGEASYKVGSTLVVNPSWQGRKLGVLSLTLKQKKIAGYKIEEVRLSDEIPPDARMQEILPRCFSDDNCKENGISGLCLEPGSKNARCAVRESKKVKLTIVTPKDCQYCNSEKIIEKLKAVMPSLEAVYIYSPSAEADAIIKQAGIEGLPAYLAGKELELDENFDRIKSNFELKGDLYILKAHASGYSYFTARRIIPGKVDLFLSPFNNGISGLLDNIKSFNPDIHLLVTEQKGVFDAAGGQAEAEEDLRLVCVKKYYPANFWDYLKCRAVNMNSSWWENCLDASVASAKIKACATSEEGKAILRENIILNRELKILLGPTLLIDNQKVFSIVGTPTKEALERAIGKKKE